MSFVVKYQKRQFTPASEGLHQAVCVDVVDLGLQPSPWGDKPKLRIIWQIEELNDAGNRQTVAKQYTVSLHEKAALRKDLETWRGRKFTQEELEGFDLEKLVGVNGQIQIVHNITDDGNVYGNVQAVVPVGRGMTLLRPDNYIRVKDRAVADEKGNYTKPAAVADDDVPF